MYFPPRTQMLRTVPKLNRATLRQAVMIPLCLGTTLLSHIFITLITLFLPGLSPVVPKTGLEPVRLATSDFESDKSTNFITRA